MINFIRYQIIMKQLITLFVLLFSAIAFSQNIQFTDQNFKNLLINFAMGMSDTDGDGIEDSPIDLNSDGEIDLVEAAQVILIDATDLFQNVTSLQDLDNFTNLKKLRIDSFNNINLVPTLNLSLLEELTVIQSDASLIDISNNFNINILNVLGSNSRINLVFGINNLLNFVSVENVNLNQIQYINYNNLSYLKIDNSSITNNILNIQNNMNLRELRLTDVSGLNSISIENNVLLKDIRFDNVDANLVEIINFNGLNLSGGDELIVDIVNSPSITDYDFQNNQIERLLINNSHTNSELNLSNYFISQVILENFTSPRLILQTPLPLTFFEFHISITGASNLSEIIGNNQDAYNIHLNNSPGLNNLNLKQVTVASTLIENNSNLSTIFLGNQDLIQNWSVFGSIRNNPSLIYVCGLENNTQRIDSVVNNNSNNNGTNNSNSIVVNSYCSFTPAGEFNEIQGNISMDIDNNACDPTDPVFSNFNFTATDVTITGTISSNQAGTYYAPVTDGQHTITPNPENPSYWNFSPPNVVVDFPAQASPFTQDFCVTANGSIEDLEVIVLPLELARPGFDTDYKVVIKNKGNVTTSGSVTLDFEEDFMTLLSSNPNAGNTPSNQLSWSFSNLQPFQMEEYEFTMTLNTPTATVNPLNSNDILTFTGTVTGMGTDAMPADNTMVFDQTVLNSYDPNDKTCLEGKIIEPSLVGEYVHYIIRFENTGTASAVNIVVKDEIDLGQFDITTLIPLGGSHDYYTRVRDNNVVEFIHKNINLDFNDATNDGYVLFKIKTLPTLIEGDTFDNTAEIYFDFNFPIITNTETVTIMSTASIGETTDTFISVYPNPARDFINITSTNGLKSATLIDVNGRRLSQTNFIGNATEQSISLENLTSGVYFVTIQSEVGQKVEKVIVE
jgi:hypothetical protein